MHGSVLRATLVAALLAFFAPAPSTAAVADLALVLNGGDHTLSSVDLPGGASHFGLDAYPSWPGNGVVAGGRYVAAISGAGLVIRYDAATLVPLDTLATGAGSNPYAVAADAAGNVWVTLLLSGEVARFDASGAETGRAPVGRSPQGILLHDGRLFVANTGFRFSDYGYDPGTVSVLDAATLAPLATVAVGLNPQWIAGAGDEVHVICTGDYFSTFGEAHVLDAAAAAPLDTVVLGGSPGFICAAGSRVFASDYFGGLYAYDLSTRAVLYDAGSPLAFGGVGYSGLAYDGAGTLYVTLFGDDALAAVDAAGGTVSGLFPTGDGPQSVALRLSEPVPVRLLAFHARRTDGGARLEWAIADGDDVAGWRIERASRIDGTGWTALGEVAAGRGTTFLDVDPPAERTRYRLLARGRDGSVETLGETALAPAASRFSARLLANPARGAASLAVHATEDVDVLLLDIRGRVARSWPGSGAASPRALDLAGVAAGRYLVVVRSGVEERILPLTVLR